MFRPILRTMFPSAFGPPRIGPNGATLWRPPVNVRESDTEVVVEAELPGIAREDIAIRNHDGRLILEGQRKDVREAGPEAGDANGCGGLAPARTDGRQVPPLLRSAGERGQFRHPGGDQGRRAEGRPAEAREGAAAPGRGQRQLT